MKEELFLTLKIIVTTQCVRCAVLFRPGYFLRNGVICSKAAASPEFLYSSGADGAHGRLDRGACEEASGQVFHFSWSCLARLRFRCAHSHQRVSYLPDLKV